MAIEGLSEDFLAQLLAGSREKGAYGRYLVEFFDSGEAGICANDTFTALAGKAPATVSQGFKGAAKKANVENLRVITSEDKVYLLNTEVVAPA